MSAKLKGTLIGIVFSLGAIALWIILSFVGFIAGIAGALMGVLFILGYRKLNPTEKSKYPIIVACILIVVEIIVAEFITVAILAGSYEVPFAEALSVDEVKTAILIDVLVGLALSFVVFAIYLSAEKKKKQQGANRIHTGTSPNNQFPDGQFPNNQIPNDPFPDTTNSNENKNDFWK